MKTKTRWIYRLAQLEKLWGTPQASWTIEQWRESAELLDRRCQALIEELESAQDKPKKRGRRPKPRNWIFDRFEELQGAGKARPPGRPEKYDDEFWQMVIEIVRIYREKLALEGAKKVTDKGAIQMLVEEWASVTGRSKREVRYEVGRWQRLHSRAKAKIAKLQNNPT